MLKNISDKLKEQLSDEKRSLFFAAVAGVTAIPVAFAAYKLLNRGSKPQRRRRQAYPEEIQHWDEDVVMDWLYEIDVGPDTVKVFQKHGIDGSLLSLMQEGHLRDMGVDNVGDRLRVVQRLEEWRSGGHKSPQPRVSPQRSRLGSQPIISPSQATTQVHGSGHKAPSPDPALEDQQVVAIVSTIVERLKAMYAVFGSQEFLKAPLEQQEEAVEVADKDLQQLVPLVNKLPQPHKDHVLPLTERLASVVSRVKSVLEERRKQEIQLDDLRQQQADADKRLAGEQPKIPGSQKFTAEEVLVELQQLKSVLDSKEIEESTPEQRFAVLRSVSQEAANISKIAENFDEKTAATLKQLAMLIAGIADERRKQQLQQHETLKEATAEEAPQQHASLPFLVQRIQAVFTSLQSPKLLEMSPAERQVHLDHLKKEVASLRKELQHLPKEHAEAIGDLVTKVSDVIKQVESIGHAQQQAPPQSGPVQSSSSNLQKLVEPLRNIMSVLKSKDFNDATVPAKQRLVHQMDNQLNLIAQSANALEPDELEAITPTIQRLKEFVSEIKEAVDGAAKAQEDVDAAEGETAKHQESSQVSREFAAIVANLKHIDQLIRSEDFLSAPTEMQSETIAKLITHADDLHSRAQHLPRQEQQALSEPLKALKSMLSRVSDACKPKSTSQRREQSTQSERSSAPAPPSPVEGNQQRQQQKALSPDFVAIVSALKDVDQLLRSDDFLEAAAPIQRRTVAKLLEHVNKMRDRAKGLSPQEREALSSPINALTDMLVKVRAAVQEDEKEQEAQGEEPELPAMEIVNRLQDLFAAVNGQHFSAASHEEQQEMASTVLEELGPLEEGTSQLPEEQQETLLPLIESIKTMLTNFVSGNEEAEGEQAQEEEEEEDNEEEDEQRRQIFDEAKEATKLLKSGKINTVGRLQGFVSLLDDLDRCGVSSTKEIEIRQAFHKALSETMKMIETMQSPTAESAATKSSPKEKDQKFQKFFATLLSIQTELEKTDFSQAAEIAPFMTVLDEVLSTAQKEGLNWRANSDAVNLVRNILTQIQTIQSELSTRSEVQETVTGALQDLRSGAVQTPQDLSKYIELLEQCKKMEDSLTVEDLQALQELQQEVLSVAMKFRAAAEKALVEESEKQQRSGGKNSVSPKNTVTPSRDMASLTSPNSMLRVPPNTPSTGVTSPNKLPASQNLEQQQSTEDDRLIELLTGELYTRLSNTNVEQVTDVAPYVQILESLHEKRKRNARLDKAAHDFQQLMKQKLNNIGKSIADVKNEVANSKRESIVKLQNVLEHPLFSRLPQEQQMNAIKKASGIIESLTPAESAELNTEVNALLSALQNVQPDDTEAVHGSAMNQLNLLPRIVERLQQSDFAENTTLFEIQCISKILSKLTDNEDVQATEEFRNIVGAAKDLFSARLNAFTGETKQVEGLQSPMNLSGMLSEDVAGHQVHRYLLFSPEEEEYTEDPRTNQRFRNEIPAQTSSVDDAILDDWAENSEALIVTVQQYEGGKENTTSLSEVSMLFDVLSSDYGFNVNCLATNLTSEGVMEAITEIADTKPTRFLIFFQSPEPSATMQRPHQSIAFPDGSVLLHDDIMASIKDKVSHAVILHDSGKTLDTVASLEGKLSPHVGVSLTDGAFCVSNTSRCWLYDGLFTPMLMELLCSREASTAATSAEEIINYAVRLLATDNAQQEGNYLEASAINAPFLTSVLSKQRGKE